MMSKKANGKSPGADSKKWSFLDTSKQILNEEKSLKNSIEEKINHTEEVHNGSDNIVEAEPDVNQLFKPT